MAAFVIEELSNGGYRIETPCRTVPDLVEFRSDTGCYRLTSAFREWLMSHCEFRIRVHIDRTFITIAFDEYLSATAFKFRWY